jgi:hypothetical protein
MKKSIAIGFLFLSLLLTNACTKSGCTDKYAENYNSSATSNDGSCKYRGSLVFWYNQTSATDATNAGYTTLTYYVNGSQVGSSAIGNGLASAPTCGASGTISSTQELGTLTSKSFNYMILASPGTNSTYDTLTGTATITANPSCTALQLVY